MRDKLPHGTHLNATLPVRTLSLTACLPVNVQMLTCEYGGVHVVWTAHKHSATTTSMPTSTQAGRHRAAMWTAHAETILTNLLCNRVARTPPSSQAHTQNHQLWVTCCTASATAIRIADMLTGQHVSACTGAGNPLRFQKTFQAAHASCCHSPHCKSCPPA
jgi:hypothetical protein